MIIAIDGPAASGKSTTAKGVAERLGFLYLDTGAMYRVVTLAILRAGVNLDEISAIESVLSAIKLSIKTDDSGTRIFLGDEDVSDLIRGLEVTQNVSVISALPIVRQKMVLLQQEIVGKRDAVVEGRDIGTIVFPNADFKFYIVADYETRAARRGQDLKKLGIIRTTREIIKDLKRRDLKDSSRNLSPLTKAEDAIEIDTSKLSIEEQIDLIVKYVKENSEEREE